MRLAMSRSKVLDTLPKVSDTLNLVRALRDIFAQRLRRYRTIIRKPGGGPLQVRRTAAGAVPST